MCYLSKIDVMKSKAFEDAAERAIHICYLDSTQQFQRLNDIY